MRIFALLLQYTALCFGLYLIYFISVTLISGDYVLMDVVADIGTFLLCVDLFFFLYSQRGLGLKGLTVEQYTQQLEKPRSKWINFTHKLGHLGIMLILCSWIVPFTST